jgi:hypothetical protein
MAYRKAVKETTSIGNCYREGLQAIKGGDRSYFALSDPRKCNGSVDLDSCLLKSNRSDNRWDYTIGLNNQAYFIEIHPAQTGEVGVMLKKLEWLKSWLEGDGKKLNAIRANPCFFWIASGKFNITKTSRQYRLLSENQLLPKSRFNA